MSSRYLRELVVSLVVIMAVFRLTLAAATVTADLEGAGGGGLLAVSLSKTKPSGKYDNCHAF